MKTGWLSPFGELVPCTPYEHITVARKLVEFYGYPTFYHDKHHPDDEALMQYGWAYIGKSELDFNYRVGWNKFLTDAQKNFLAKYFDDPDTPIDRFCRERWNIEMCN